MARVSPPIGSYTVDNEDWVGGDDFGAVVTVSGITVHSDYYEVNGFRGGVKSRYAYTSGAIGYCQLEYSTNGGASYHVTQVVHPCAINANNAIEYKTNTYNGMRFNRNNYGGSSYTVRLQCWVHMDSSLAGYSTGSRAGIEFTVSPKSGTAPSAPTNVVTRRNADNDIEVSWTLSNATPAISSNQIEVQIDDGAWTSLSTSLAASATTYTYTAGEINHKYCFRVRSVNAAGTSGYGTSNIVYTSPAAPQQGYAYQKGDLINASIITANISYPGTYEWQISPDGTDGSWTTLDLDIGATVIEDYQTEYDEPWFRVRCFSPTVEITGETLPAVASDWCTPFQASKRYEIYVNIPEGTTPQAIYVNVPDGTDSFDVLFRI